MSASVWSKRRCDLVLLGGLVALLLPAYALFSLWTDLMAGYQEVAEEARHRTAHYLRVAQRQDALQAAFDSSALQDLIKQNYLTGEAPGVAYAGLQQQIKEVIAAAGGVALSTQLVQEPQDPELAAEKIIVRVRMQGDSYVLQKVVQTLETRKPLLFFEQLSVQAPGKVKEDQAERLDIRFDVYGYFWKESL